MKYYFAILSCLSVTACATLTPEQAAERRMRWSRVATSALEAGFVVLGAERLPNNPSFRK